MASLSKIAKTLGREADELFTKAFNGEGGVIKYGKPEKLRARLRQDGGLIPLSPSRSASKPRYRLSSDGKSYAPPGITISNVSGSQTTGKARIRVKPSLRVRAGSRPTIGKRTPLEPKPWAFSRSAVGKVIRDGGNTLASWYRGAPIKQRLGFDGKLVTAPGPKIGSFRSDIAAFGYKHPYGMVGAHAYAAYAGYSMLAYGDQPFAIG